MTADFDRCSFCGHRKRDGLVIVHGPRGANICVVCTRIATEFFQGLPETTMPLPCRRRPGEWWRRHRWRLGRLADLDIGLTA